MIGESGNGRKINCRRIPGQNVTVVLPGTRIVRTRVERQLKVATVGAEAPTSCCNQFIQCCKGWGT